MKRGVGDCYATNKNRCKLGYRCELAGATDLYINSLNDCHFLLCRKFVRNRPARFATDKTQLPLPVEAIDFVNHTIDIERKTFA